MEGVKERRYDLKASIDKDISENIKDYANLVEIPDPKILVHFRYPKY